MTDDHNSLFDQEGAIFMGARREPKNAPRARTVARARRATRSRPRGRTTGAVRETHAANIRPARRNPDDATRGNAARGSVWAHRAPTGTIDDWRDI